MTIQINTDLLLNSEIDLQIGDQDSSYRITNGPIDSIFIDGNGNLSDTATYYGWSGSGAIDDPIDINQTQFDNFEMKYLLEIRNTDLYILIQDCTFTNGKGIRLLNVVNVNISSNQISNSSEHGVFISDSENNTLYDNEIYNNSQDGILCIDSTSQNISHNTVHGNGNTGINVKDEGGNFVVNNTVYKNSYHGIAVFLDGSGLVLWDDVIKDNFVYNNSFDGIYLGSDYDAVITNNTISNNGRFGIYRRGCRNTTITFNRLSGNGYYIFTSSSTAVNDHYVYYNAHSFVENYIDNVPIVYYENEQDIIITEGAQIVLIDCVNITIKNIHFRDTPASIIAYRSSAITICHNSFRYILEECINLHGTSNTNVTSNQIDNSTRTGIYLRYASNPEIFNNSISNHETYGIYSAYGSSGIKIINNTIFNNSWGGNYGGLYLSDSTGHIIVNNSIYDNDNTGMYIRCSNSKIINNSIFNNADDGIDLYTINLVTSNLFQNNVITNNADEGISIRYSDNNTIENNLVRENGGSGIYCIGSNENTISKNIILKNDYGIYVSSYSTWNNITDNIIYDSAENGLTFANDANDNLVRNNTISSNYDYGVELDMAAENNTIYRNNFINNHHGYTFYTQVIDPSGMNNITQNYWSDHLSIDDNGDGYFDEVYTIDSSKYSSVTLNNDSYPLVGPINPHHNLIFDFDIFSPTNGSTVSHSTLLEWVEPFNTFDNPFTYNIYYKLNSGTVWTELVNDHGLTSYNWEVYELANGTYNVKIEAQEPLGSTVDEIITIRIENPAHTLTSPTIVIPSDNAILNETITIAWSASIDSWGETVYYDLYYANNDENPSQWNLIIANLTTTSYPWDTSEILNGNNYSIKIESKTSTLSEFSVVTSLRIQNEEVTDTTTSATSTFTTDFTTIPTSPSSSIPTGHTSRSATQSSAVQSKTTIGFDLIVLIFIGFSLIVRKLTFSKKQ
jgi:parallel beta-helix repeat protein